MTRTHETLMALCDAYANHRMIDGAQDVEASQQSRNTRDALHAAVEAMAAELEDEQTLGAMRKGLVDGYIIRNKELEQELEAAKADAARYRWFTAKAPLLIFTKNEDGPSFELYGLQGSMHWNPKEIDAAIDAARKEQP